MLDLLSRCSLVSRIWLSSQPALSFSLCSLLHRPPSALCLSVLFVLSVPNSLQESHQEDAADTPLGRIVTRRGAWIVLELIQTNSQCICPRLKRAPLEVAIVQMRGGIGGYKRGAKRGSRQCERRKGTTSDRVVAEGNSGVKWR